MYSVREQVLIPIDNFINKNAIRKLRHEKVHHHLFNVPITLLCFCQLLCIYKSYIIDSVRHLQYTYTNCYFLQCAGCPPCEHLCSLHHHPPTSRPCTQEEEEQNKVVFVT